MEGHEDRYERGSNKEEDPYGRMQLSPLKRVLLLEPFEPAYGPSNYAINNNVLEYAHR